MLSKYCYGLGNSDHILITDICEQFDNLPLTMIMINGFVEWLQNIHHHICIKYDKSSEKCM